MTFFIPFDVSQSKVAPGLFGSSFFFHKMFVGLLCERIERALGKVRKSRGLGRKEKKLVNCVIVCI